MSNITENVSYILVPFHYDEKKSFDSYIAELNKKEILRTSQHTFKDEIFLDFVEAVYRRSSGYEVHTDNEECEVQLQHFATGIGFISFRLSTSNEDESALKLHDEKVKDISEKINSGEYELLNRIDELTPKMRFFPTSKVKKCAIYSLLVAKLDKADSTYITSGCGEEYIIDRLHKCYFASNKMTIVTNQYYKNLSQGTKDIETEEGFRRKYEQHFFMAFMLLHNERRSYLMSKGQIVDVNAGDKKTVKQVKSKIIDLLSCFSFKIVTEDIEFQRIYTAYREVLNLADCESEMSELVFRLDDEIEKGKEKKITVISLLIAVLGLFQLISVVLDIIG